MQRIFVALLASLFLLPVSTSAFAEAYPEKSVQMIVPFNPGGGSDLIIRLVEKNFQEEFEQALSFIYKPGASGAVGMSELKTLKADGYTLASQSYPHILIQELSKSGQFTVEDFDYLGMVAVDDIFFAVKKSSQFKTMEDFIQAAKADPSSLSVATTDTLGCTHMAALKLHLLDVPINIITYPGGSKALAAFLGGQVDAIMVVKGAAAPSLGSMNLLAICNTKKDPTLPEVRTFTELGYDIVQFNGRLILSPKGLPADVRERLMLGIKNIYSDPDVQERAAKAGFEIRLADGDEVLEMFRKLRPEAEQLIKLSETLE